jgi:hypothetical protein
MKQRRRRHGQWLTGGCCLVFLFAAAVAGAEVEVAFVTKLLAPDGAPVDRFGYTAALSDDRLVVSALGDDDMGAGAGALYVFGRNQGGPDNWGFLSKLVASDIGPFDRFGQGLSLAGDVLIAGILNTSLPRPGAAYVFDLSGEASEWREVARLAPADSTVNDFFGRFLATDGDTALIGAFGEDSAAKASGAIYVFEADPLDPAAWMEISKIKAPEPTEGGFFGRRFGFDGDALVVAAIGDDAAGEDAGAAHAYQRVPLSPTDWQFVRTLRPDELAPLDNFGRHTSLDGDMAAVGAWRHDAAAPDAGAVWLYRRFTAGGAAWADVAKLLPEDPSGDGRFGIGLAMDADLLAVGAPFQDGAAQDTGIVYVFARNADGRDAWGEVARLIAPDAQADDLFGYWLTFSDGTLVVGARQDDNRNGWDAGAAYVYQVSQPLADVGLRLSGASRPIEAGQPQVVRAWLRNSGPAVATAFRLAGELRGALSLETVQTANDGECRIEPSGGLIYACDLGDLAPGETVRVDLLILPQAPGPFLHAADSGSLVADPDRSNNSARFLLE